jgi:hypothetical protein
MLLKLGPSAITTEGGLHPFKAVLHDGLNWIAILRISFLSQHILSGGELLAVSSHR